MCACMCQCEQCTNLPGTINNTIITPRILITTFSAPHLGCAEHTKGARWSASQPQLAVDTQVAVGFGQLLGRPDLDGLHLMRSLRLDAVGGQQLLQPHGFCDQHHLDHQVWRCPLCKGGTTSTVTPHKAVEL